MRRALSLAGLGLLLASAPAAAQDQVLRDYQRNGQIDPCQYSASQRKQALNQLPSDIEQYAPGLADQLRRGGCAGGGAGTALAGRSDGSAAGGPGGAAGAGGTGSARPRADGTLKPPAVTPARATSEAAAPAVTAADAGGVPGWVFALAAGFATAALGIGLLVRYGVLDPRGLMPGRS